VSLGAAPQQRDLFRSTTSFCASRVADDSIYTLLHRECFRLLPDELFSDLFTDIGRRSVPPMVVAVVMVLQRLEGLSDREAVQRFEFDARWKYAAGGLDFDYPGFVHTVLVDMRARLAASEQPNRIFDVVLDLGRQAGLVGRRRVLDSSPIYDAVATMDTVTMVRSAIREVLVAAGELAGELRAVLRRDDDYASAGKPLCDYEDRAAREALVDALATDGRAVLMALQDRALTAPLKQAVELLAAVLGQDLEDGPDGRIRIARRVAKDRIISTVDSDARHGHKTKARSFDGFKGHVAIDPDSELVTATAVTPGNHGDGTAVAELLGDELAAAHEATAEAAGDAEPTIEDEPSVEPLTVYGDSAYGAGPVLQQLERSGVEQRCKVQPPRAPAGHFTKDAFTIDLATGQVTCPAGHMAELTPDGRGQVAHFAPACGSCALAAQCTTARGGRSVHVGPYEVQLAKARREQTAAAWQADYRATRPKVERKLAHLLRRLHGGRRARVRGQPKVAADFALLAAAANLARLAVLGLTSLAGGWALRTT
jgi:Transposase DDE domain/Transposase domain (DUF772)